MSFHNKYLKYKSKYLDLKNKITQKGGSTTNTTYKCNWCDDDCNSNITCPECKSVYYCCQGCKSDDKISHTKICKRVPTASNVPSAPTTSTVPSSSPSTI